MSNSINSIDAFLQNGRMDHDHPCPQSLSRQITVLSMIYCEKKDWSCINFLGRSELRFRLRSFLRRSHKPDFRDIYKFDTRLSLSLSPCKINSDEQDGDCITWSLDTTGKPHRSVAEGSLRLVRRWFCTSPRLFF